MSQIVLLKKLLSRYWPWGVLLLTETVFFLLKVSLLSFRFGDGNAYWYMADVVRQGVLPYRDFFLADPPVFVFFLVPFVTIFRSHLLALQMIPSCLEMLVAAGLFLYLKTEKNKFYWAAPILYLFSYTILATSDYGTGLQLASCFVMAALLCWQRKKFVLMGALLALACLTKGYMAPIVLTALPILFYQRKWKAAAQVMAGGVVTTLAVVLPCMVISGHLFIEDTVVHQLARPEGISKLHVFSFFIAREWLFLMGTAIGIWFFRQKSLVYWLFFGELCFFILFKDLYYAYLGSLVVYMTIYTLHLFECMYDKGKIFVTVTQMAAMTGLFFVIFSVGFYLKSTAPEGRFVEAPLVAAKIAELPQNYQLYGSHEVVPLVALLTHKKIFNNVIDSNTQTFASAAQNREEISRQAVQAGVYLVIRGAKLPNRNEVLPGFSDFFSVASFNNHCKRQVDVPVDSSDFNQVLIYSCT